MGYHIDSSADRIFVEKRYPRPVGYRNYFPEPAVNPMTM